MSPTADWLRARPDVKLVPTKELIDELERNGQTYINTPDKAQWLAGQLAHFNLHSQQRRHFGREEEEREAA